MRTTLPWMFVLLFVALKLMGVIAWGWLWVFAPVWGLLAFSLTLMGVGKAILAFVKWRDPAGYARWELSESIRQYSKRLHR